MRIIELNHRLIQNELIKTGNKSRKRGNSFHFTETTRLLLRINKFFPICLHKLRASVNESLLNSEPCRLITLLNFLRKAFCRFHNTRNEDSSVYRQQRISNYMRNEGNYDNKPYFNFLETDRTRSTNYKTGS